MKTNALNRPKALHARTLTDLESMAFPCFTTGKTVIL